mgnify:CR=1 FL=1
MNSQDFLNYQLTFPRVQEANQLKYSKVKSYFDKKNMAFPNSQIFWRAFKWNKALELWAFNSDSQCYVLVKSFPICEIVGDLGPKRQEGDFQIPEGFYYLENFNPNSKYHLSLKVSYPNLSDSLLGVKGKLGGDIYVHGKCETIGCLPMTDTLIQEIYLINLYAKANGQELIPIHIFPTKLSLNNMNKLKKDYFNGNTSILNFWNNLKEGFEYFEKKKILPLIIIDPISGKYLFQ